MGRTKGFERNDVLDKAIQVFWKKGYADTSLSDLEKATGVNKSGLYGEFKDKDDLYVEALKRYHSLNPAFKLLERAPLGWGNIKEFLEIGLTCTDKKGCFMAISQREISIIPTRARAVLDKNGSALHDHVMANVKAVKPKLDPEALTQMILTFCSGASLRASSTELEDSLLEIENFLNLLKKA